MFNKLGSFVVKFSSLILFFAVCYVALFYAYGYEYDARKKDVVKTSIIDLIGNIREARVSLNGKPEANFLPYQIKNVDPGDYELGVNKKGFLPWVRKIQVEEDIVTIVNDILLVPDNLGEFTKVVKDFNGLGKRDFGSDLVLSYEKGSQIIHLLGMAYDGTFKDEDLELAVPAIESVEPLGNDRFLIGGGDENLYYFDLKNRRFAVFNKPAGAYGFKFNAQGDKLFFFIKDSLFLVKLEVLTGEVPADLKALKTVPAVTAVEFGFPGEIYYVSGGVLYKTDESFKKREPLALSLDKFKNLSFSQGRDFGYLILRNDQDRRTLYLADRKGRFKKLDSNLEGNVFHNGFDQTVYSVSENGKRTVEYYDANLNTKKMVMENDAPVEIIGWFSDEGHFVFRSAGKIKLGDVFNANVYDLLDDNNLEKIFVFSKNLFYLKDGKLFSLNWRNLI